ncbi:MULTISPECIES: pyruvate, water dikinase regulatory protein [Chromobacterium]|uniref:posphoenolpyruvate synthetase regulatory kinase/phosphorylase PpsR n=1 Tax=Chromobacterium TaxID=535 RepID=UPI000653EF55|nr:MULTISPECIES: pyruvate, water dikinase regulatory protein [Chromobacterium]KMN76838.1 PEP synthetase regulatory protein [Chromobacterium sp. LK11]MBN3004417.1 kinase/pyrophosphorylase [Chromobacterium alkanivorans]MCP1289296.1 kinase/pyrophosphorylase [Chromobacterium sp. S0633]MCS3805121.1 regulator of PEP synthase PpsR (kinase-PPPase family) [Chromobacterium alkanivorans]MCS3819316.1 regulator of PEP synthase PpsR (kinase-PPPase family) [Chromobacterium alkanivorans]
MPHHLRSAFFVSDRTGITAESLGHTLLTQFDTVEFKRETIPFVDTVEKAQALAEVIRQVSETDHLKPLVFTSIINPDVRSALQVENAVMIDFFDTFIGQLEQEIGQRASLSVGKAHGMVNEEKYDHRIEAVNFSLNHDDGVKLKDLHEADVILVGVSRSGKTPTCLYLALQYGIRAANYPLTPEDLGSPTLPKLLLPFKDKIFGLTIDPARLHHIRSERRPDSKYASMDNCRREVNEAESMFRHHGVPFISTTHKSIEEIASTIMHKAALGRRF